MHYGFDPHEVIFEELAEGDPRFYGVIGPNLIGFWAHVLVSPDGADRTVVISNNIDLPIFELGEELWASTLAPDAG